MVNRTWTNSVSFSFITIYSLCSHSRCNSNLRCDYKQNWIIIIIDSYQCIETKVRGQWLDGKPNQSGCVRLNSYYSNIKTLPDQSQHFLQMLQVSEKYSTRSKCLQSAKYWLIQKILEQFNIICWYSDYLITCKIGCIKNTKFLRTQKNAFFLDHPMYFCSQNARAKKNPCKTKTTLQFSDWQKSINFRTNCVFGKVVHKTAGLSRLVIGLERLTCVGTFYA